MTHGGRERNLTIGISNAGYPGGAQRRHGDRAPAARRQATPSFFCRLVEDVVYWKSSSSPIHVAVHLLGRERRLVEAGENELQLDGIGVDVTDGKDAGRRRLELLGIDGDEVLGEVEAPSAIGPSFIVRPKNGSMVSHDTSNEALSLPRQVTEESRPSAPLSAVTWPMRRSILPSPPARASARRCAGRARKSSRRCIRVTRSAMGWRFSVSRARNRRRRRSGSAGRGTVPSCARRRTRCAPRTARCW